ncbi:hypothetical protein ACFLXQ_01405 [Chloroflexota bacterium]
MPFQLPAVSQLANDFEITEIEGYEYVTPENSISGSFRQATEGDSLKRDDFITVPVKTNYDSLTTTSETRKPKTLRERYAYEVYLTLTSLDLLLRDGKPLCQFRDVAGVARVKGTFAEFKERWGTVDTPVAMAIHNECVKANTSWYFAIPDDDDVDATIEMDDEAEAPEGNGE